MRRSEMTEEERRTYNRERARRLRAAMTEEQREAVRAKDRLRAPRSMTDEQRKRVNANKRAMTGERREKARASGRARERRRRAAMTEEARKEKSRTTSRYYRSVMTEEQRKEARVKALVPPGKRAEARGRRTEEQRERIRAYDRLRRRRSEMTTEERESDNASARSARSKRRSTEEGRVKDNARHFALAQSRRAAGDISTADAKRILETRACYYCGVGIECMNIGRKSHPRKTTIDHKHPIARGGTNDVSNLVAACAECNGRKATMTAEEFFAAGLRRTRQVPSGS